MGAMPPPLHGRKRAWPRPRARALALGLALTAAACGGGTGAGPAASLSPACPPVEPPPGIEAPLLPRTTCELPQFDPARFEDLLAQLRGVPVVVNIWASWCGPCVEEAPHLARLARATAGRVQFLGVDILDQLVPARAFVLRFGWPYPSVFDPRGAIRDSLGLLGQPHTLVFDREGRRVFTWSGPVTEEVLRRALGRALGG